MEKLKVKREQLVKEYEELNTRHQNLAGNMRILETRMVEIQGSIKFIDEVLKEEEEMGDLGKLKR